jgi:hypothetical protein
VTDRIDGGQDLATEEIDETTGDGAVSVEVAAIEGGEEEAGAAVAGTGGEAVGSIADGRKETNTGQKPVFLYIYKYRTVFNKFVCQHS